MLSSDKIRDRLNVALALVTLAVAATALWVIGQDGPIPPGDLAAILELVAAALEQLTEAMG